jgi:agmatine deiminase
MATEPPTPRSLGYRMPAEWETHAATWLAWPHNANDWPGRFHPIPWVYCDIVRHLSRVEDVHLLVNDAAAEQRARGMLGRVGAQLDRVHFHQWPTDRVWLRDSGPIFITKVAPEASVAITNWHFNAWAKYPDWQLDDQLPSKAAELLGLPSFTPVFPLDHRVVLEGGSIDVNGRGTLITT